MTIHTGGRRLRKMVLNSLFSGKHSQHVLLFSVFFLLRKIYFRTTSYISYSDHNVITFLGRLTLAPCLAPPTRVLDRCLASQQYPHPLAVLV